MAHSGWRREMVAGITTFSTIAYILVVNPLILADAGIHPGAAMVATALTAALATLFLGVTADYPFVLGPGMGLNAYFTYGVVGAGGASWQEALGAAFLSGVALLILTASGARRRLLEAVPSSLRVGITAGLGLFLAFIAFRTIGIVKADPHTILAIGQLDSWHWLCALAGVVAATALRSRRITGALFYGMATAWLLALLLGEARWQGVVEWPPSLSPTFFQLDMAGSLRPELLSAVLSFIAIPLFDSVGTLTALAQQGKLLSPEGTLPRARRVLTADAIGTMLGSLLGTSPVTIYLESGAGIASGGRKGFTAVVAATLFLAGLFFYPLVSSIPPFAATPALLLVAILLLQPLTQLPWNDPTEVVPACLVAITIPFTFNIAAGIGLGFLSFPLIKLLAGRAQEVDRLAWCLAAGCLITWLIFA